jgi:hypothetical protein
VVVDFDDAEKDLNISVFDEKKQSFSMLEEEDWKTTRKFFEQFVIGDRGVL